MSAREEILDRIRRASANAATTTVPREYRGAQPAPDTDLVSLFAERVSDYRATVRQCEAANASRTLAGILRERGIRRVVTPAGLPDGLLAAADVDSINDDPPMTARELDAVDGVVTTCACAIALTGTIVLDHGAGQGRRAVSLVPDYHLVVVRADQIGYSVPDAIAILDPTRPQTWISGPSATSDIELNRVEGVHGPRTLDVLIVTVASSPT